jgi:hypothetical protein
LMQITSTRNFMRGTARRISRLKGARGVIPSGYAPSSPPRLLLLSLAIRGSRKWYHD